METQTQSLSPERRAKFWIGGAVIVAVLVGLILWAMTQPGAASNYRTPTELSDAHGTLGQVQLAGVVAPGSIEQDGLVTTFVVTDDITDITVTTDTPMPDAFKDSSEVVAIGTFDGDTFTATKVLAKCPSKFKAKV
ncbi:MAG: cytochrome c-type biosis protein CcmE [Actinomycetota bacterium]|jgi:cytochrome c-type biogenesis protein CcmE|nr:cytochrome c-type biosis protein CcmE [Actinomycetota bacterium]